MTTYIAMLRGINVGGKNIVKMADLRKSLEAVGFNHVRTYIQSGNIIFETLTTSITKLAQLIQQKIMNDFGFSVSVTLKTPAKLKETIKNNPFLAKRNCDPSKLHLTFLSEKPEKIHLEELDKIKSKDQIRFCNKEVYLFCPNGYGRTKFTNNYLEKTLMVSATTRNWRTITKLYELSQVK